MINFFSVGAQHPGPVRNSLTMAIALECVGSESAVPRASGRFLDPMNQQLSNEERGVSAWLFRGFVWGWKNCP